jgi:hypothetical protein
MIKEAAVILFAALLMPTCARAQPSAKACLLKATEALPKISGLQIKKSRTRPLSAEHLATWKGERVPIIVDIDIVAPGQADTFSFICVTDASGQAFARRVTSP